MEHFERLELVNTDKKYNRDFLDYLNSLKNNTKISLLITSAHKIATNELFLDGKAVRGSVLETEPKPWTNLRLNETENFLVAKCNEKPSILAFFNKNKIYKTQFIAAIGAHNAPFDFMQYAIENINVQKDCSNRDFEKIINTLIVDFEKTQKTSVGNKIGKFQQWLNQAKWNTGRVLNITKMMQGILAKWKVIAGIIALGYSAPH